jgi:hypothetical protein
VYLYSVLLTASRFHYIKSHPEHEALLPLRNQKVCCKM